MQGRSVLWGMLVGALISATAQAQSGDDERARAHFESGRAYYDQARYEDAAREFEEAYRLSPRPELLENISRAQERALMFDEAIATLERLLATNPSTSDAATIRERITNLQRLRSRLHGGGATPTPATPGTGGGGGVSVPGLISLIGGGALGLGALFTGIGSQVIYDDLSAACGGVCPPDRQGDVGTGEALAITSTVLTFAAPVAIALGILLLVIDQPGSGDRQSTLRIVPGPGQGGLGLEARF